MTTELKPCTVKGCKAKCEHHHDLFNGRCVDCGVVPCGAPNGNSFRTPLVGPRPTREQLQAEIDRLTAENADLAAKLREDERLFVELKSVEKAERSRTLGDLAAQSLSISINAGDAEASVRFAQVLTELHREGLNGWTAQ